jgi:hypothetical protein
MKERRRGVIVNVGSAISLVAPSGPLLSAYTASKVRPAFGEGGCRHSRRWTGAGGADCCRAKMLATSTHAPGSVWVGSAGHIAFAAIYPAIYPACPATFFPAGLPSSASTSSSRHKAGLAGLAGLPHRHRRAHASCRPDATRRALHCVQAYIDSFSRSLDAEAREFGVRVQNQAPMFVATKMSKIRRARLDAPTPDAWAAAAVAQIGQETSSSPYWFHGLQVGGLIGVWAWCCGLLGGLGGAVGCWAGRTRGRGAEGSWAGVTRWRWCLRGRGKRGVQ